MLWSETGTCRTGALLAHLPRCPYFWHQDLQFLQRQQEFQHEFIVRVTEEHQETLDISFAAE